MLKHVSFVTKDADATLRFYTALGGAVTKDLRTAEGYRRVVLQFGGGGRLQFFQAGGEVPAPHASWMEHVALHLSDLRGQIAQLKAQGAVFTRELGLSPSGAEVAFVQDPDGRQVELLQAGV